MVEGMKKKRVAIIAISSIVLVAMVAAIVAITVVKTHTDGSSKGKSDQGKVTSSVKAIKALCQPTDYQQVCEDSLKGAGNTTNPKELLKVAFNFASDKISKAAEQSVLLKELDKDNRTHASLDMCKGLLYSAIDEFKATFDKVGDFESSDVNSLFADLRIWLSAAMTYQETCLDAFENKTTPAAGKMRELLNTTNELTSNALAMITEISTIFSTYQIPSLDAGHNGRRLLTAEELEVLGHGETLLDMLENGAKRKLLKKSEEVEIIGHEEPFDLNDNDRKWRLLAEREQLQVLSHGESSDLTMADDGKRKLLSVAEDVGVSDHEEYPEWLRGKKRSLLNESPDKLKPNVVVAKDGSGDCKTINEALKRIPKNRNDTFVLKVKEGVYEEQVEFTKEMSHVFLTGDGQTKTKITGSLSYADGIDTPETATVKVFGDYFMAKDIGFENTAGAVKREAVALRVQADFAAFYKCQMDGYQSTLFAHAKRQFYRDCTASGTIDIIFGDAAALFQNCTMLVRKPLDEQICTVTAQGRTDRRQPSAIVLQGCVITAAPEYLEVKDTTKTYLGRPWKEYARTVIMQSYIDDIIQPDGWVAWAGNFNTKNSVSVEYNNTGPGSSTKKRVTWPGIKKLDETQILKFTGKNLLLPDTWVNQTGFPYIQGLMQQNPSAPSSTSSSPSGAPAPK